MYNHTRDAATRDRLGASCTQRATLRMIMRLAVRHAFVIEERTAVEWLSTVLLLEEILR
jgi:hypothetical protein